MTGLSKECTYKFIINLIISLIILIGFAIGVLASYTKNNEKLEIIKRENIVVNYNENIQSNELKTKLSFSRNLSKEDKYLLAKIAMAEAEGESIVTKIFVIETILNRVESNDFPNTIKEVIFEENNGIYQFSPVMLNGRWWTTEPNDECYEAVEIVNITRNNTSKKTLYFESCLNSDNWHSRNLEFLFELDGMRFYK